jgi:proteasome assembly chaperone (PAC2) family protein
VQRPEVRIDAGGVRRIDWPAFAFRYSVVPGRFELVTGVGAEPHLRWRSFCDEVIELAQRLRVRRVLLLGAFLADVLYSRPVRISGFGSPGALPPELGVQPTGIVGVLGSRLALAGIETASLWAGLPHYIGISPNPRGMLALVQKACQLLDLPIDQQPLERDAAEFEARVSQLVASDPALSEYVRELKKREFAQ